MNKAEVCEQIKKIGIVPAIRVSSAEEAHFAADAVTQGGIAIVEITMTVPEAVELISHLVREHKKNDCRGRHGAGHGDSTKMRGRRCAFLDGARVRCGDCRVCRKSKRYGVPRRIHADRGSYGMAMWFGLCQSVSLWACRTQIH